MTRTDITIAATDPDVARKVKEEILLVLNKYWREADGDSFNYSLSSGIAHGNTEAGE